MDINENIKLLCRVRGTSFSDLADRLNITRQTLYKQSTGAAQLASIERIAAALNVPTFIILHPAPLAALMQYEGRNQAPEIRTEEARPAVFTCPICGTTFAPVQAPRPADDPSPATWHQQPDEAPAKRKRGRPRKTNTDSDSKLF